MGTSAIRQRCCTDSRTISVQNSNPLIRRSTSLSARAPNTLKPHWLSLTQRPVAAKVTKFPMPLKTRRIMGMRFLCPKRFAKTMSALPACTGDRSDGISCGSCCPSASSVISACAPSARAAWMPVIVAAPGPQFSTCSTMMAPALRACSAVSSEDPSSTTMTLSTYGLAWLTTSAMRVASLYAGMTARVFMESKDTPLPHPGH